MKLDLKTRLAILFGMPVTVNFGDIEVSDIVEMAAGDRMAIDSNGKTLFSINIVRIGQGSVSLQYISSKPEPDQPFFAVPVKVEKTKRRSARR